MTTYIVIMVIYLAAMFAVGIYGRKYVHSFEDFVVAGRRGTVLMVGCSFMASHFGGGFVVGGAEKGAQVGLGGAWFGIACALSYFVFLILVRRVYRLKQISIPDFLEYSYGDKVTRVGFSIINIFACIGIIGGQIMAGQRILQAVGLEPIVGSVVSMLIVVGYSTLSGLWGVLATDVIQIIIGTIGIVIALISLMADKGLAFLASSLPATNFDFIPFTPCEFTMIVVPTVLYGFLSQPSFQRVHSCKDEATAWKSTLYAAILLIPISFIPPLIGMYGTAMFPGVPDGVVFIKIIVEVLNPVFGGLVIAAVFAALMSTADTLLLAITAHGVHDIYRKVLNPQASEKTLMQASYLLTAIVGVGALILSLTFTTIIGLLSFTYSILVSGTLIPVLGAFFWKRGTAGGAFASMVVGIIVLFLARWKIIDVPYPHLFALIPGLVAYVLVSLAQKPKDAGSSIQG